MIIFIYGEDNFSSKKYLDALLTRYRVKEGATNLISLEGEKLENKSFLSEAGTVPLLANVRLFVIRDFLAKGRAEEQKKFLAELNNIPSSSVLIFYETGLPDRRNALFKKLSLAPSKSRYFPQPNLNQARHFIQKQLQASNLQIREDALASLIERAGLDFWRLSLELDKLSLFAQAKSLALITKPTVDLLVSERFENQIFRLLNHLAHPQSSFREYRKLLETEDELYLLSMLVFQLRLLLLAKTDGLRLFKIGSFQGQKAKEGAAFFNQEELKKIYRRLLHYDYSIKTGKIEKRLALDLLMDEIARRQIGSQNQFL